MLIHKLVKCVHPVVNTAPTQPSNSVKNAGLRNLLLHTVSWTGRVDS